MQSSSEVKHYPDLALGHTVETFASLPSTNTYLSSLVSKSSPSHGTAILAYDQPHGRGQIGREWNTEPGKNLQISYLFRPASLAVDQQYLLNFVVALAVANTVSDYGLTAHIKWPNDIYIGHKKVAGILIQCGLQGNQVRHAVVGIGLNINQCSWPDDIPNPISLSQALDLQLDLLAVASHLSEHLSHWYEQLVQGKTTEITRRYHDLLYLRDQERHYQVGTTQQLGMLTQVDQEGRAVIMWSDGQEGRYRHGEIGYL